MQKTKIRRMAAALLSVVCVVSGGLGVSAQLVSPTEDDIIIARYTILNQCSNNFSISSSGVAACTGFTKVSSGYTAGVTINLQQYDGGWNTIKSWADKDSTSISLTKKAICKLGI